MFPVFKKPHERLKTATANAAKRPDRERAIADLTAAITKDAGETAASGNVEIVVEAYSTLAGLYQAGSQYLQVVQTLEGLRRYQPFGPQPARDLGLRYAAQPGLVEADLIRLADWLATNGWLVDVLPALRSAVDERFRRSAALAERLAEALMQAGIPTEATQRFRAVIDLRPEDGPRLAPRLQAIIDQLPDDQLAHETLGLVCFRQHDYDQAAAHLTQALKLGALEVGTLFCLADAGLELGRWDEAAETLQRLLDKDANEAELIRRCERLTEWHTAKDLAYCRAQRIWGDALRRQARYEEALARYRLALDSLPSGSADFAASLVNRLQGLTAAIDPAHTAEAYMEQGRAHQAVGAAEQALEAYLAAANTGRAAAGRAVASLRSLVAQTPDLLPARLHLAALHMDLEDWRAAFETLEAVRRELPDQRHETVEGSWRLLEALEKLAPDADQPSGAYAPVFSGALYALAEELATADPRAALAQLRRLLQAYGAAEAEGVRQRLEGRGLLRSQPFAACLLEGDAFLAAKDYPAALQAYDRAPREPQTIDELCERYERLAEADALNPAALLAAATARQEQDRPDLALPLWQRAFERDHAQTAETLVTALDALRQAGQCPPAGLSLLADAYTSLATVPAVGQALDVTRQLFAVGPEQASLAAAKAQAIQAQADPAGQHYPAAALLLGEALAAADQPAESAAAYSTAIGHPKVDEAQLLARLTALTEQRPDLPAAWLALGQAHAAPKKPRTGAALEAYAKALGAGPEQVADQVIERAQALKLKGDEALRAQLLQAEALILTQRGAAAIPQLRATLAEFEKRGAEAMLTLAERLPDGVETWFLRAEIDAARRLPEPAAGWLERVARQGADSEVERAEKVLRTLAKDFPASAAPRLGLALGLKRLGRIEEAAKEWGNIAKEYPSARAQAMAMLDELSQATPTAAVWLSRARGFIEDDIVPATLEALEYAAADTQARSQAYELLQAVAARHADQPEVLRALVRLETQLASEETLAQAAEHARAWLEADSTQSGAVAEHVQRLLEVLQSAELAQSPTALQAYLILADAQLADQKPEQAAAPLRMVLQAWPTKGNQNQVVQRCRRALERLETLALRLVLADAYMQRDEHAQALETCTPAGAAETTATELLNYIEPEACQALAQRCEQIALSQSAAEPELAARAGLALAEWRARLADAEGVVQACQAVADLAALPVDPLANWLAGRGWEPISIRRLRYARLTILRQAGPETFEAALATAQVILEADPPGEAPAIMAELERFPTDYLLAWRARLELAVCLGVEHYPEAYALMRQILAQFGPQEADWLLELCARMDANQAGVHLLRSEIQEAAGQLEAAAAALLGLHTQLPETFPQVEQAFQGLIDRHPDEQRLRLALGQAYRQAAAWPAAQAVYRQVQQADETFTGDLVAPYGELLEHLPQDLELHWALAEAHWYLEQPYEAAGYVDALTDLEPAQAQPGEVFLARLVKKYPACGRGWYVRGKLAYRLGDHDMAIEYLERALKKGELPQRALPLLHEMLSRSYHQQSELDHALEHVRQAISGAPDNPALRQLLLNIRFARLDRTIAERQAALEKSSTQAAALELADLYQQRGQYPQAIELLQKALSQAPEAGALHLALARCFAAQQLYHLSATSLEAALESGSLSVVERKETLYRLAQARRSQLRFEDAIAALEQVCAMDVNYQNVLGLIDQFQREKVTAERQAVALQVVSKARLGAKEV
jgi:tetratricopeptide (TPR) repeat protein